MRSPPFIPDLFLTAAIGMGLVGLDGKWLNANPAVCKLLGFPEEELILLGFRDTLHPDDDAEFFARLLRDRDTYFGEQRFRRKDGHSIWILLRLSLVRDSWGAPRCFFAQLQDITPLKEAEEAQDRLFRLPVALHYVAGFDGYFKRLSPSWAQVLGYDVEHLLSVPFFDLIHPEDRGQTTGEFEGVMRGTNTFLFENRYRHADGTYRWLLWTSITAPKDKLIYGVALDYTKRKEAELKLAETAQELERVISELQASNEQITKLRTGFLKVCAWTKQVEHEGRWIPIDEFLSQYLKLNLTHGISEAAFQQFVEGMPGKEGNSPFPLGGPCPAPSKDPT